MVVVVFLLGGEHLLGLGKIDTPMHRETRSPQRAVEGFADAVVDRFAGPGKVETHVVPLRPVIEGGRGELGPVVALHDLRQLAAQSSSGG
jgi:hypothetical protein